MPALAVALAAGCQGGFDRIDREVDALLDETARAINEPTAPSIGVRGESTPWIGSGRDRPAWASENPSTVNPSAGELEFAARAEAEADDVMQRLEAYGEMPADAMRLDLEGALAYSVRSSREFRFAQEEFVLSSLRLLTERHRWGPRFFDEVSARINGIGDDSLYDTSLSIVNELRVTQRLPYGGEISARALADATEDLHQRVAGEPSQTAAIILEADIPLLRGAGLTAREDRIQAERSMIYAARTFARFRREFLFSIARDYLGLIVNQQQIENRRLGVESFQSLQERQEALYVAGRSTPFDAAEAKNQTLDAIDRLNSARESYRLALDRFKVRIGMPVDQPLVIESDRLDLPSPRVDMETAVRAGMSYRLDLQTERDRLEDAERAVANARNDLLGDLDLTAAVTVGTDDERERQGLRFNTEDAEFSAGLRYNLPLDREIERLALRQRQIDLARAERGYDRFRDEIAITVRGAVRGIDSALFSLQIQEANVAIAEQREASIEADPARADIRQKTDAINATFQARDARDSARRDLEVAVLLYLLETGQLRVADDGWIEPLSGMEAGG